MFANPGTQHKYVGTSLLGQVWWSLKGPIGSWLWPQEIVLRLGSLLRLLGEEYGLDIGEYTTLGDGDAGEQLLKLLVVPYGQLQVAGDDPGLLVVTGCVPCQLEDLSGQVLHDCSHVDWGTSSHTSGIVALPEETVDTSHRELEASPAGAGLCLSLHLSALATSRHDDVVVVGSSTANWLNTGVQPSFMPLAVSGRVGTGGPSSEEAADGHPTLRVGLRRLCWDYRQSLS